MAIEEDKKEGINLIKDILNKLKDNLEKTNEIFLSEDDLKFSFAQVAKECGAENIILEYPIMTHKLYEGNNICELTMKNGYKNGNYKCKNECKSQELYNKCYKVNDEKQKETMMSKIFEYLCCDNNSYNCENLDNRYNIVKETIYECLSEKFTQGGNCCNNCSDLKNRYDADRTFIDLAFKCGNTQYFIEFKYKLAAIYQSPQKYNKNLPITRYGNKNFTIKYQGATDIGRHAVYEDIERMENVKNIELEGINEIKSFVIFITNQSDYWRINQDKGVAREMPLATIAVGKNSTEAISTIKKGLHLYSMKEDNEYRRAIYLDNDYELSGIHKSENKNINNKEKVILSFPEFSNTQLINSGWYHFKTLNKDDNNEYENTQFNCLIIDISKRKSND